MFFVFLMTVRYTGSLVARVKYVQDIKMSRELRMRYVLKRIFFRLSSICMCLDYEQVLIPFSSIPNSIAIQTREINKKDLLNKTIVNCVSVFNKQVWE